MKRANEDDNDAGASRKSPAIRAMVHQAAANIITTQLSDQDSNTTGEEIQEITSPLIPTKKIVPRTLTQAYPQSSFWLNQLGKNKNEEEIPEHENAPQESTKSKTRDMRKIPSEDWAKMEAGIQNSKERNAATLLDIIKKVQAERKRNSSNLDPIVNREIRPAGRRSFFLKEWENHLHNKLSNHASVHLGMPYHRATRILSKLEVHNNEILIQTNLNFSSDTEDQLLEYYGDCDTDAQKKKVYGTMFLHFALSLNCIRPQTGNTSQKYFKISLYLIFKLKNKSDKSNCKINFKNNPRTCKNGIIRKQWEINCNNHKFIKEIIKNKLKYLNMHKSGTRTNSLNRKNDRKKSIRTIHLNNAIFIRRNQDPADRGWKELGTNNVSCNLTFFYKMKFSHKYAKLIVGNFSDHRMRRILAIFNELMEEAADNEVRIKITRNLITEANTINEHFKEDMGQLNEAKRYWIDNGNRDNEVRRKEVSNAIARLITMYEGISEYLTEMDRWWTELRNTPPLLVNFYNGPENTVFFSGLLGYGTTTNKKQIQTRVGLIELELVTQYLNIAAGKILYTIILLKIGQTKKNIYTNKYTNLITKKSSKCIIKLNIKINTHNKSKNNFLNSQEMSKRVTILDPSWSLYKQPSGFPTQNGKTSPDCKIPSIFAKSKTKNLIYATIFKPPYAPLIKDIFQNHG